MPGGRCSVRHIGGGCDGKPPCWGYFLRARTLRVAVDLAFCVFTFDCLLLDDDLLLARLFVAERFTDLSSSRFLITTVESEASAASRA